MPPIPCPPPSSHTLYIKHSNMTKHPVILHPERHSVNARMGHTSPNLSLRHGKLWYDKIPNLKKAWERSYSNNPLPIDTILVAGLNDII